MAWDHLAGCINIELDNFTRDKKRYHIVDDIFVRKGLASHRVFFMYHGIY